MDSQLKFIETKQLKIAYLDIGSANHKPVFLLHGFPYDIHSYNDVARKLVSHGYRCIVPFLRGYGATMFKSDDIIRSGQQAALGADLLALMDALNISKAILGGFDWGGRAACIVAALWPQRVDGLISCGNGYNIQNITQAGQPAPPEEEIRYWYMYYFHTQRGRLGLSQNRHALCRLIWKIWSPSWKFDDDTFNQTARAFNNPDFVDIVIHSYRHRFGLIAGDPEYETIENKLASQPDISTSTIVLLGNDDGVDPPTKTDMDKIHFSGEYERRIIAHAGHNLPQEMPEAFAQAVLDVA